MLIYMKILNAAIIAKQSKEVVRKYRLLRLYLLAPKYYTTITYPTFKLIYKIWISTKIVINNLNDKFKNGIKEEKVDE